MLPKISATLLVIVLSTQTAWASSDYYCEPHWSLNQGEYTSCSNLPLLTPSNDTRVNLKLLLVDDGFARLQAKPVSKEDAEFGYGKVPFSVDFFEREIFLSNNKTDSATESDDYVEASRCISNDSGTADFIDALSQSKAITTAERQLLILERQKLNPICVDLAPTKVAAKIPSKNLVSPTSKQFLLYLAAATAFYEGRYAAAKSYFSKLTTSNQPWLQESSRYMLGRTELNHSQQNAFDSYGFPHLEKVDRKVLVEAEAKFNTYLKDYPRGRYASSARGLLRRVYWLSDQQEKLADEYAWQLNHPDSPQNNLSLDQLVLEADNKLIVTADHKQVKNPLLLATIDLSLMRPSDSPGTHRISFFDLKKQQSKFAKHQALYEYLLAAHRFYVQKDAAGTLKALSGKIPPKMTYLDFSRLVLRGLALEAAKNRLAARKLWLSLLPASRQPLQDETLQLALALNYEYGNEVESVFKQNSPISETAIRAILVRSTASANLLRQIIKSKTNSKQERDLALYTLLYKDLLKGHYQNYIQDYQFLPRNAANKKPLHTASSDKSPLALFTWTGKRTRNSYACPTTLEIARILAKNAKDPYGLVCLGDFVNTTDIESGDSLSDYPAQQSSDAKSAVLGSAPPHFPGKLYSRGESYKAAIANADIAPDLKAYALYRSIQCYAPSGFNHCGGKDVEPSARKAWFRTLKTRYPNSLWATSLKYYW
jgi:hypothetical protein